MRKHWHKKQKDLHKRLYLEYRKEELLWHLDVFLCVNHPQWAVDKFISEFKNNRKTIRQLFTRVLICGGTVGYSDVIPYEDDLKRCIGCMLYRQYIEITDNMLFRDIMNLPRVFKLSHTDRLGLRDRLLDVA